MTQTDRLTADQLHNIAPHCDGCGAPGAAPSQWLENLCPACTAKYAIAYAASDHLRHLLTVAFAQWLDTWKDHPHITRHATDEAGALAQAVMSELLTD